MSRLGFSGIALVISILSTTSVQAQSGEAASQCDILRKVFRVEKPAVPNPASPRNRLGCTAQEMQMFKVNRNAVDAIKDQAPVTDPARLAGMWLGDDVYQYVAGIKVPGQEILHLKVGADGKSLDVTQYWAKASAPEGEALPWTEDVQYDGVVATGTLTPAKDGIFADDFITPSFRYPPRRFEFTRLDDLTVKLRINHFDLDVQVKYYLAGDTLIMERMTENRVLDKTETSYVTYSRVAPDAPEAALMLITAFELPMSQNFECFTNQLSDDKGPLVDMLSTHGEAKTLTALRGLFKASMEMEGLRAAMQQGKSNDEMQKIAERFGTLSVELQALLQRPEIAELRNAFSDPGQICPAW